MDGRKAYRYCYSDEIFQARDIAETHELSIGLTGCNHPSKQVPESLNMNNNWRQTRSTYS